MAEVSNGRARFGRFLTALGFVWFFWALFGRLIMVELGTTPLDLPILPGFAILFLGRALSRGARAPTTEPESVESPPARTPTRRPAPVEAPPPPPPPVVDLSELLEVEQPVIDEAMPADGEIDMDQGLSDSPHRMTSAEMVAQARKRFGNRSG